VTLWPVETEFGVAVTAIEGVAGSTTRVSGWDAVRKFTSVTVTVSGVDPIAEGVPEITPVVALRVRGEGSDPEVIDQV
jgi:hypothetical protein